MLNLVVAGAIVLAAAGFYALGYLVAYSRHLTDTMERRAPEDARYSAALEKVAERCQSLSEVRGWGK